MGWEAWLTLAVVAGLVVAMARDLLQPSIAILGAVILLLLVGVVSPAEAFAGFSNAAPITVAALYILAAAVEKTGVLHPVVEVIFGRERGGRGTLTRVVSATGGASAFLNNTPIVAMLTPQVLAWAERRGQAASRYLMPISFAAILGGVTTLIGTSTNILVSGLLEAEGYGPLGMFEITPVGLPAAIAGGLALVLLAPVLLPVRRGAAERAEEEVREFVVEMAVEPRGRLDGCGVEEAGLRHLQGVYLVQVERNGERIAPVPPQTTLKSGDRLTFVGRADMVLDLQRTRGLVSAEQKHLIGVESPGHTFFEAVIGESSPLVGTSLRDARFRGRYQAAVLAIHRSGERVDSKLGDVKLKVGDTLLLLADPGFRERWKDRTEFLLVSRLGGSSPGATRHAPLVGAVAIGIVTLAATGALDIVRAALAGVLVLLATRVLTPREARAALDLDVLLVIGGSFGLGAAVEASGLASAVVRYGILPLGGYGPLAALIAVVLCTVVLTELITNNAAAALIFPIAVATAVELGASPHAFALGIAVAASCSFLTPIGYQTNTMVYGPGGYRFADYARLGAPITLVVLTTTVLVLWKGLGL